LVSLAWLPGNLAAREEAFIYKRGDVFVVSISKEWRLWQVPLSGEGPFPRQTWGCCIIVEGPGRELADGGRCYEMPKDFSRAKNWGDFITSGHICIKEEAVTYAFNTEYRGVMSGKAPIVHMRPIYGGEVEAYYKKMLGWGNEEIVRALESNDSVDRLPVAQLAASFMENCRRLIAVRLATHDKLGVFLWKNRNAQWIVDWLYSSNSEDYATIVEAIKKGKTWRSPYEDVVRE
jgi:hypothetical protein